MKDEAGDLGQPATSAANAPSLPAAVDRATFQAELDGLRAREKAHTREGDAIATDRRRLPMVEVDADLALTGPDGPPPCSKRSKGADSSSPTLHVAPRPARQPSNAKGAHGITPRWRNCPTFSLATSPMRCFARVRTTRASATTTSWPGTCRGTQQRPLSTRSWSGAISA